MDCIPVLPMKKRVVYIKCKSCDMWYRANPKDYIIKFKNQMDEKEKEIEAEVETEEETEIEESTEVDGVE